MTKKPPVQISSDGGLLSNYFVALFAEFAFQLQEAGRFPADSTWVLVPQELFDPTHPESPTNLT